MPDIPLEYVLASIILAIWSGMQLGAILYKKSNGMSDDYRKYLDESGKRMRQQEAEIGLLRSVAVQIRADCDKYHSVDLDAVMEAIHEESKTGIYK